MSTTQTPAPVSIFNDTTGEKGVCQHLVITLPEGDEYRAAREEFLNTKSPNGRAYVKQPCDTDEESIHLARHHRVAISIILADIFGSCDVAILASSSSKCDDRCQKAEGPKEDCTCACAGFGHGKHYADVGVFGKTFGNIRRIEGTDTIYLRSDDLTKYTVDRDPTKPMKVVSTRAYSKPSEVYVPRPVQQGFRKLIEKDGHRMLLMSADDPFAQELFDFEAQLP